MWHPVYMKRKHGTQVVWKNQPATVSFEGFKGKTLLNLPNKEQIFAPTDELEDVSDVAGCGHGE
jgi:hypothetical protein